MLFARRDLEIRLIREYDQFAKNAKLNVNVELVFNFKLYSTTQKNKTMIGRCIQKKNERLGK